MGDQRVSPKLERSASSSGPHRTSHGGEMMSSPAPTRVVADAATPIVSLDLVDIRPELERRPHRASRMAEEHRAFTTLASDMASNPRNMLQKLVEVAVDLCDAHTAGISLLEGDVFRWEAVAGVFAPARG